MKQIFVSIIFLLGLIGCSQDPVILDLNREERSVVDSLYKEEIRVLGPKLDSLCAVRNKKRYQHIKDSLIELRLEEIESLLPEE